MFSLSSDGEWNDAPGVAFTDGVDYQIGKVGGMGSLIFGGEGLVMHFSGQGTVWVQTRNIGGLAGVLAPFFPPSN